MNIYKKDELDYFFLINYRSDKFINKYLNIKAGFNATFIVK